MQHIEFFHREHFEQNYFRVAPPPALSPFIDFFWETRFDHLWKDNPKGFSDAQFPNIGYTYIINLGTPFIMQVGEKKFSMKTDCFLPRYNAIECFHKPGNHLFGIKFRISPVIFEKRVNFAEYKGQLYPLSYLLDESIINNVKSASSFEKRISILSRYYISLLDKYDGPMQPATIVSSILGQSYRDNEFSRPVEDIAKQYKVSVRTLQRYFEICTGISSKQALQVMRIRKATAHLAASPADFDCRAYGYYDHSHFYKHLKQFVGNSTLQNMKPHLSLLNKLHKPKSGNGL